MIIVALVWYFDANLPYNELVNSFIRVRAALLPSAPALSFSSVIFSEYSFKGVPAWNTHPSMGLSSYPILIASTNSTKAHVPKNVPNGNTNLSFHFTGSTGMFRFVGVLTSHLKNPVSPESFILSSSLWKSSIEELNLDTYTGLPTGSSLHIIPAYRPGTSK